jgi:hypothetical protein
MPVSWHFSDGILFVESDEQATLDEWKAAIDGALANSDYEPGMGVLHDTRLTKHFPSIEEAKERVAFVQRCGIRRWAVLAGSQLGYGLGRMGEGLSSGTSTQVRAFKDPAEAEGWARGRGT